MEEGTILETEVNMNSQYITRMEALAAHRDFEKKEDLISTQEMSRILGTTFGNATLVQLPQQKEGIHFLMNPQKRNDKTPPKSPVFKVQSPRHRLGRQGFGQMQYGLNSVSENNLEESKS